MTEVQVEGRKRRTMMDGGERIRWKDDKCDVGRDSGGSE